MSSPVMFGYQLQVVSALVGKPAGGQIVMLFTPTFAVTFPADFLGSQGSAGTNASATALYAVKKNGAQVGTVSISTLGVFTFSTSGLPVSLVAGDRLVVFAPSSQDVTLSDVTLTFVANQGGDAQFLYDPAAKELDVGISGPDASVFIGGQLDVEAGTTPALNIIAGDSVHTSLRGISLQLDGQAAQSAGAQGIFILGTQNGASSLTGIELSLNQTANGNQTGIEIDLGLGTGTKIGLLVTSVPGLSHAIETQVGVMYARDFLQVAGLDHPLFSNLPAPSVSTAGMIAFITDSTTNVWGANISGSGGNKVLAFNNGTNWTVMAK